MGGFLLLQALCFRGGWTQNTPKSNVVYLSFQANIHTNRQTSCYFTLYNSSGYAPRASRCTLGRGRSGVNPPKFILVLKRKRISFVVKENHIGTAVSKILLYKQTDRHPVIILWRLMKHFLTLKYLFVGSNPDLRSRCRRSMRWGARDIWAWGRRPPFSPIRSSTWESIRGAGQGLAARWRLNNGPALLRRTVSSFEIYNTK